MEIAAEQAFAAETPENQVRVGDGGLFAAAVANRPRLGAGAFRADAQRAAAVKPGNRPAASANRVNFKHRNGDGKIGDHGFVCCAQSAFDQRNIGGRAAHIETDDARKSGACGHLLRAEDSSSGARENRADRFASSGTCGKNSSAGLHHANLSARSIAFPSAASRDRACGVLLDFGEISRHDGHEIGVHDGGGCALEFTEFRQDFVGHADLHSGRAETPCEAAFVLRTQKRKEEADRYRIRARGANLPKDPCEFCVGWLGDDSSVGSHAFTKPESAFTRNEGLGALDEEIVEARASLTANF